MSSSTIDSSSIPMRRKRTATEQVTENTDPLLAKKKAHESTQMAPLALIVCDTYKLYHIPSMQTVSRNVKRVFVQVRKHISKMLQVMLEIIYNG
jgi:hypothetical protein